MPTYRNEGDAVEGERIICTARKVTGPDLIEGSSAHRLNRLKLSGRGKTPAFCVIDRAVSWID